MSTAETLVSLDTIVTLLASSATGLNKPPPPDICPKLATLAIAA
jgi:hypothetical protein